MRNELMIFGEEDALLTILSNQATRGLFFWDAVFEEIMNNASLFEFSCQSDHEHSHHIHVGNQVAIMDRDGDFRLFTISAVESVINPHRSYLHVTCEDAVLELARFTSLEQHEDYREFTNVSLQSMLTTLLSPSRWQTGDVAPFGNQSITILKRNSLIDSIGDLIKTWRTDIASPEIRVRVTIDGNQITGRYVDLINRGTDTGLVLNVGHNVAGFSVEVETAHIKTALMGMGRAQRFEAEYEGQELTERDQRRLNFRDVEGTIEKHGFVKPLGSPFVTDENARKLYGTPNIVNGNLTRQHREGVADLHRINDAEELMIQTWEVLQQNNKPRYYVEIDMIALAEIFGNDYNHEQLRLGDTVRLVDKERFTNHVLIEARVISIDYDISQPESLNVRLGNHRNLFENDDRLTDLETEIGNGSGDWDSPIINEDNIVVFPRPIENFSAVGLFASINVSWTAQTIFTTYELHASEVRDFTPNAGNFIYRGTISHFNHPVKTNNLWYYRVRAVGGGIVGPWSEVVSAQTATFDLSELENALEELERDLQDLEQELYDLNNNVLPNVQGGLEDLNDRLQGIEDLDIGTIVGDFENRIADNEEALYDLNNNVLPSLQDDLDDLYNSVLPNLREDLEREIEDLNTNLDNLNDTIIPNLNSQLGDLNSDLDDLHENVLPNINDTLTDLNTDLADLNTALDDLANSIPDDVDLSNIYSRLAGLELGLNNLNNNIIPEINADLNQLHNTALPNLQAQLNTLNNTTIPALSTRLTTNEGAINTLNNTTLPTLREDLAELDELTDSWRWENTVEIDGGAIRANTIHANRITAGTITSTQIGANQITANEIATGTITANEIATNTITANEIATNAIVTRHISTNSVTANEIAVGTITAQEIASSTITGDRLVANTINSREINANAITTNELASGSVTADNIVAGTITGDRLAANSITARELLLTNTSNLAHASEHLPTPVGGGTIVNADGHPWIQFGNATASDWHSILIMNTPQAMFHQNQQYRIEAIVRRVDGTAPNLRIDVSNTFTTGGTQYVSGGVGMPVDQPISETESLITWNLQINHNPDPARTLTGSRMRMVVPNNIGLIQVRNIRVFRRNDANLVVDGSITANSIASGSITTNHMNAGSINGDRITVNTLNANRITAESITSDRIGANQITAINIATDAIQTRHLSTNSITANEIASGSITTNHMSANTINGDRIQTNTLNANRITAGSITTDRMTANSINGDRIQTNTLNADRITANSITGDRLQANSITTRELVITDFTNLAQLNQETVSVGMWGGRWNIENDGTGTQNNPWFAITNPDRDMAISEWYPANAGEQYRVVWEIDNRGARGATANGGDVINYVNSAIQFECRRHNEGTVWPNTASVTNAHTTATGIITIPANTFSFRIRVTTQRWNPHSGTVRIRGLKVTRMANAQLIVDGSITANSIASGSITTNHMTVGTINGDRIQTNTLNANRITAGSITTDRMSANSINGDRIQANTLHANRIQADTLTANMITAGTMHGDRIQAGTLNANRIVAGTMSGDRIQGGMITGTIFQTVSGGDIIDIRNGRVDVRATHANQTLTTVRMHQNRVDFFDRFNEGNRIGVVGRLHTAGDATGTIGIHMGATSANNEIRLTSHDPVQGAIFSTQLSIGHGGLNSNVRTNIWRPTLQSALEMNGNAISLAHNTTTNVTAGSGSAVMMIGSSVDFRTHVVRNQGGDAGFTVRQGSTANFNASESGVWVGNNHNPNTPASTAGFWIGQNNTGTNGTIGTRHRNQTYNWDMSNTAAGEFDTLYGANWTRVRTHTFSASTANTQTWAMGFGGNSFSHAPFVDFQVICDAGTSPSAPQVMDITPQHATWTPTTGISFRLHRNGFTGPVTVRWRAEGRRSMV